jgi:hypothetical protein
MVKNLMVAYTIHEIDVIDTIQYDITNLEHTFRFQTTMLE